MHRVFREACFYATNGIVAGGEYEPFPDSCIRHQGCQDWLLIYTIQGSGDIRQPETRYITEPGDLHLWHPGTYQEYGSYQNCWHILWCHFMPPPEWNELLRWQEITSGLMQVSLPDSRERKRVEECLYRMVKQYQLPYEQRYAFSLNALHEALLWIQASATQSSAAKDARIAYAQEYICEQLGRNITLADIAQAAGLSISRFSALFKKQIGKSVIHYLEEQRILKAEHLLIHTGGPIQEISEKCGFQNPFYFSQRFSKRLGMSPSDFRKRLTSSRTNKTE